MQRISEKIINLKTSLDIPRDKMPQIDSVQKFKEYLKENDIDFERIKIPAKDLTPTQSQLETDKADNIWAEYLKKKNETSNPLSGEIVVSKDKYILDGHHRWFAVKRNNENMRLNCLMLGDNAKEALKCMREYEGVSYRDVKDKAVSEDVVLHRKGLNGTHFYIRTDSNKNGQWWDVIIWREINGKEQIYDKKKFNSEQPALDYVTKSYDKYESTQVLSTAGKILEYSVKEQIKKQFKVEDKDFEKAEPSHAVKSIAKTKDGYVGFSHRAAYEFKIGDKLYDPEWGKDEYTEDELSKMPYEDRGEETIKTTEQAREAACRFARDVS
jgi:hypothetical protein